MGAVAALCIGCVDVGIAHACSTCMHVCMYVCVYVCMCMCDVSVLEGVIVMVSV